MKHEFKEDKRNICLNVNEDDNKILVKLVNSGQFPSKSEIARTAFDEWLINHGAYLSTLDDSETIIKFLMQKFGEIKALSVRIEKIEDGKENQLIVRMEKGKLNVYQGFKQPKSDKVQANLPRLIIR